MEEKRSGRAVDRQRVQDKLLLQEAEFYERKLAEALEEKAREAEATQGRELLAQSRFAVDRFVSGAEKADFFAKKVERCNLEHKKLKMGRKMCILSTW